MNEPGKPIVTRSHGARFYCLNCEREYRNCTCKVYQSADLLADRAKTLVFVRGEGIPIESLV